MHWQCYAACSIVVLAHGAFTAVWYCNETLRAIVRPYAGAVGPGFHLVPDSVCPSEAKVYGQALDDKGIDAIYWTSRSPDLKLFENLWDIVRASTAVK